MRGLKRYPSPRYPTRVQILDDPGQLERHLPPEWTKLTGMKTLLSLFLAAATLPAAAEDATEQGAVVAPIFVHGEGRGATGCVVIAPPVFLSEEEALQVIREELKLHGVTVTTSHASLGDAVPETTHNDPRANPGDHPEIPTADLEIPPDGVRLEFISGADYFELGGRRSWSTVQSYDFRRIAETTTEHLRTANHGTYAVFYDPVVTATSRLNDDADRASKRIEARRLLRLQVRDFVDWMAAQGIL